MTTKQEKFLLVDNAKHIKSLTQLRNSLKNCLNDCDQESRKNIILATQLVEEIIFEIMIHDLDKMSSILKKKRYANA